MRNRFVREVTEYLAQLIDELGPLPGARLSQEMRKQFPDFDYGEEFSSFTQMLDRGSELTILERRGADLLWGRFEPDQRGLQNIELSESPSTDKDQWLDQFEPGQIRYDEVSFSGFKSLKEVTVPLSDFVMLVGPNGAGKTSILQGLSLLSQLRAARSDVVFSGPRDANLLRSAELDSRLEIRVRDSNSGASASVDCRWDNHEDAIYQTRVRIEGPESDQILNYEPGDTNSASQPRLAQTPHLRALGPSVLLRLDAAQIAKPSWSDFESPAMRHDGFGLPSVLAHLASFDPDRVRSIVQAAAKVIAGLTDVRMPRHRFDKGWGHRLEARIHGRWLHASLLSEGTLLSLALFAFVYAEGDLKFILLDDIDRALHPKAQGEVIKTLRGIQTSQPGLRFVCTSHSPYLLDHVDAESIVVVRADEQGWTQVQPLVSHPEWQEWKDSLLPGEFWSHVGEDWLSDAQSAV